MKSANLSLLLEQSRKRNSLHGITGLLVHDYGAFLQVLEGNEHDVNMIFASIARDQRHTRINVLIRERKPLREFNSWSMAWADISHLTDRGPQYSYDLPQLRPEQATDYLHKFLRSAAM